MFGIRLSKYDILEIEVDQLLASVPHTKPNGLLPSFFLANVAWGINAKNCQIIAKNDSTNAKKLDLIAKKI